MKKDIYYLSKDNITTIHAIQWIPEGEIRGILQIVHGMCEFIGRYDDFANYMTSQGYMVVGNDHLGHGESVQDEEHYGFFNDPSGNECLLSDIHTLRKATQDACPGIPYFLLGHSMGSFLARQYICRHGKGLTGAIIMGTGSKPDGLLKFGMFLSKALAKMRGSMHISGLITFIAFGAYNKRFKPNRTPSDWLTKDTAIVDAYLNNPWCTFPFTVNAFYHMFRSMFDAQQPQNIRKIPKSLPILVTSGTDDPVGDFTKGVHPVYAAYQNAGIADLQLKLYEGDRHEILNETDRAEVYADILQWIGAHHA